MQIKKRISKVSILAIILLFAFFLEEIIRDYHLFSQKYGLKPTTLIWLFGIAEIFFNFGIVLMLWGSGIFKIGWKEIKSFNFEKVKFSGPVVYYGFFINRLAALIPWFYILTVGWDKLPKIIISLILVEILTVIIIGSIIKIPKKQLHA